MASTISANFGTATALTITLASLASSSVGVGRQSALVDNTGNLNLYQKIHIYWKITTGTSPTANTPISFYLIKADKNSSADSITDGAGVSDLGLTIVSAKQIDGIIVSSSSNVTYQGDCVINNPGPVWGIAVVQGTVVALNSTVGNHGIWFVGENQSAS